MDSLSTNKNWFVLVKGGKANTDHLTNGTYIIPDLVPALAMCGYLPNFSSKHVELSTASFLLTGKIIVKS